MTDTTGPRLRKLLAELTIMAARVATYEQRARLDRAPDETGLLAAMAISLNTQALRLLRLAHGVVGHTADNLKQLKEQELPQLFAGYAAAAQVAEHDPTPAVANACGQAARVTRKNLSLLCESAKASDATPEYHVCGFCGYVHQGEVSEHCPVCQAPRRRFLLVGRQGAAPPK